MMGIKISACVITKNEEKNLPYWIKCVAAIADEMIVVDTGSSDTTIEIARNGGAEVYFFDWIDDFSAAKNYALEQATGDWIVFLDADEYFTENSLKSFKKALKYYDMDSNIAALICRTINIDKAHSDCVISTSLLPRVFRNSPDLRYKWAIHEQLENKSGNKKMVFAPELEIIHTGYSEDRLKSKYNRNLSIMMRELENAETEHDRKRLYPYIANEYNSAKDFVNAIRFAKLCIDNNIEIVGDEGKYYGMMILAMLNTGYSSDAILEVIAEAQNKYPKEPLFEFCKGFVLFSVQDYIGVEDAFCKGFMLREDIGKRNGAGVADTSQGLLRHIYEKLGYICEIKEDRQAAIDCYVKSLQSYKYQRESLNGLCRLLKGENPVEIISLLESIYDKKTDADYLLPILKKHIGGSVFVYYSKYAKNVSQADVFMAIRRFDAAAAVLIKRYETLINN